MSDPLLPVPDAASAPFFTGALEGHLMLQRCNGCARWHYPVRTRCPQCGSRELEWARASGRGTLYSHGTLRRAAHPDLARRLPVILAVVDLEEGVRMNARLADSDPERVEAGMPVEVVFEALSEAIALPVFRRSD